MYQSSSNAYENNPYETDHGRQSEMATFIKFSEIDEDLDVVSVIITVNDGDSYDNLFRAVPQRVPDGRVLVCEVSPSTFRLFEKKIDEGEITMEDLERVEESERGEIKRVIDEVWEYVVELDVDSVVFNLECCDGFEDGEEIRHLNCLLRKIIDRGHMIMASDFAMKGLIKGWSEEFLGPAAFVKVGETSTPLNLRFDCAALLECPSSQLQKVAELCENGSASIKTMGGTILFDMVPDVDTDIYTAEVLTVVIGLDNNQFNTIPRELCTISDNQGIPGHAVLHYRSGGMLLASAGHWIELSRLDVSEEALQNIAQTYGEAYYTEMNDDINQYQGEAKKKKVQEYASKMVQQSAPAKYSKKKSRGNTNWNSKH